MQTIGTKQSVISGEPGAIGFGQPGDPNANIPEGVAHGELDSIPGEDTHRNANAPVHPVGMGPVVLLEENGAAGKNASIEGDGVPHVELQEPGVSHLTTPEEVKFLTSSLSPSPHIILEAASTQCPPAVNTTTPGIPEPDRHADLELPHDTQPPTTSEAARTQRSPAVNTGTPTIPDPEGSTDLVPEPPPLPPDKATEPNADQPPKYIRAPTDAGGQSESLPGEAPWRAMGQTNPASARASEGKMPVREAHGRPPDLPNPQTQGSTAWEPKFVDPKAPVHVHLARKPVLDEGSALQLEGEQNINIPNVGSELHAAPTAPQISSSLTLPPILSPPDTLAHENPLCRDGTATEQHAIEDLCPECLKLPNLLYGEGTAIKWCATKTHHPKPWKSPNPYIVLHK
jgi:hypothetical protein